MIIIKNKIIPPFYKAVTIWPFIFYKGELSDIDLTHEKIHGRQQLELVGVFFYILYIFFAITRIGRYSKGNPFEVEAYNNETNLIYLDSRKFLNWKKYL